MRRLRTYSANYPTLTVEGGLLPQALLDRLAKLDRTLPGFSEAAFHLAPGEKLNEAITESWNRLQSRWQTFSEARDVAGDHGLTTLTREKWLLPLFQELGYGRLTSSAGISIDAEHFPISHQWHHSPIHLLAANVDLDKRTPGVAGAARKSPHGLLQECLNVSDSHLWGIVSNGLLLRLLRDSANLTRQAYIQFDLEAIFATQAFPDFALLWLLTHQSRFEAHRPTDCWLEQWVQLGIEQGIRAQSDLRQKVEDALEILGIGFLDANPKLREELRSGAVALQDFQHELLRFGYRLLFLFVAEDRDALLLPELPESASPADRDARREARDRVSRFYSTARLRHLAGTIRGTAHTDLMAGLWPIMCGLRHPDGLPGLALPYLGSFLWSDTACPHLENARLKNRALLTALRHLSYTEATGVRQAIDYRNLDAEELGSIYESLLELHPRLDARSARTGRTEYFAFDRTAGSERKTTGSYYTPDSLVQCLLDSALEPVIAETLARAKQEKIDPVSALLALTICDPAVGSGHFLLAAGRRLARRVAVLRSGEEEPSPEALRTAMRDVVSHCLYGVDLNPLALELCKVALWLEALEPGKPLNFLDSHLRCGNALLGLQDLSVMDDGIPDAAFVECTGDPRGLATRRRKRNREERGRGRGQTLLMGFDAGTSPTSHVAALEALEAMSDADFASVMAKAAAYARVREAEEYDHTLNCANLWCGAFLQPLREADDLRAITQARFEHYRRATGPGRFAFASMIADATRLADQAHYNLFHWPLEFGQVFVRGGFDVVLGNPPWERIKLQEQEFFASRVPEIAGARTAAERKRRIAGLRTTHPDLWEEFQQAAAKAERESHFMRQSGRYPLCGRGDVNTYALFAETNLNAQSPNGRAGFIVPSGIATDDTTKFYFQHLVEGERLVSLYHFDNRDKLFPDVGSMITFALLTFTGRMFPHPAEFVCFAHRVEDVDDPDRRYSLTRAEFGLINPNTRTLPIFRTSRDAALTKAIYSRVPVLIREGATDGNPWGACFMAMLHMANDSERFRTRPELEADGYRLIGNHFVHPTDEAYLPLYEAKMVHHFDHRWATYQASQRKDGDETRDLSIEEKSDPTCVALPRYWVPSSAVAERLSGRWDRGWLLGWRDICRSTDERTVIASVIPSVGVGHNLPISITERPDLGWCLVANLGSLALDFVGRKKVGGTHLSFFISNQLPIIAPVTFEESSSWVPTANSDWLLPRVLELTYTAWDLQPFAQDCGYDGPPFQWDEQRRAMLRAELDAAFFLLYGIEARDDVEYILGTFPVLAKNETQQYGEYRTRRLVLERYDALQQAIASGVPYQTPLDPPPGDPRAAHAERHRGFRRTRTLGTLRDTGIPNHAPERRPTDARRHP